MIYERYTKTPKGEPFLCYCDRDAGIEAGVRYGPVIRDVYIIECFTEGSGSIFINGREFKVSVGSCFFLLPGDTVIHTTSTRRSGYWCAVDGDAVGEAMRAAGITSESPFAPREIYPDILHVLERMYSMREENDLGVGWRRTACIYEIIGRLLRTGKGSVGHDSVKKAIGLMESCYHTPLTVSEIAYRVGLERSYFSTLFRSEMGTPPHTYLSSLRVRKACVLLRETDMPISEVAEAVGLDVRNFSRIFKAETGVSPRRYRGH